VLVELCAAISLLTAAAEAPPGPTAFVAQVRGRPSAESPDGRTVAVETRQVLPGDWLVTVPSGAGILLICSSDRRVDLEAGPKAREIGRRVDAACAGGEPSGSGRRSVRERALPRPRGPDPRLGGR
jgi:hypothetical protein